MTNSYIQIVSNGIPGGVKAMLDLPMLWPVRMKKLKISQKQLAEMADVCTSTLSEASNGKSNMTFKTFIKVEDCLSRLEAIKND